LSVYYTTFIG